MVAEAFLPTNQDWNILAGIVSLMVVIAVVVKVVGIVKHYLLFHNMAGSSDRHFLYGHFHNFPADGEDRIAYLQSRMTDFNGRFSCFWQGAYKTELFVYHPDLVKKILQSSAPKSRCLGSPYRLAMPWVGEGLIIANGNRWARSRRLLTPAFHFEILKDYVPIYNQAATNLFRKLDEFAETGESFDICPLLNLCTLEIILRCAFGFEADVQGQGHPYIQSTKECAELFAKRARTPWLWYDFLYRMSADGKAFFDHCNAVHKMTEDIIDWKKRESVAERGEPTKGKHLEFIDILLSARDEDGKPMTAEEIRNEVDTFLFAGHDSSAVALQWALYCLAKHTDWQARVQEEIDSVLDGRHDSVVMWQDLPNLELLTVCIKESMRLYPPVPFIQRQLNADQDFDGNTVPAGTIVTVAIIFLHRNLLVWDEPEEFRPERFQTENRTSTDSFAFIPFAAGVRNCLGQSFVSNEEKVLLARILHRYNVRIPPDANPPQRLPTVTLKAENGIWLTLQRR